MSDSLESIAAEVYGGGATAGAEPAGDSLESVASEVYGTKAKAPEESAAFGVAPKGIKRAAAVPAGDDAVTGAARALAGGVQNAGIAARDLGQKMGVLADPAEEAYIQQNARTPAEIEALRAEYQAQKKSGGVMFQGEAPRGSARAPQGEINRPAGPSIDQLDDQRYKGGVDAFMRDATPEKRAELAGAPIPYRVGPPARAASAQIDAENAGDQRNALTAEGRVARRVTQGMTSPDAQASIDMERALGVGDRGPLAQVKKSDLDIERLRQMEKASFGTRVGAQFGDTLSQMDAGRALMMGELTGDGAVAAGALQRIQQLQTRGQEYGDPGAAQKFLEQAGVSVMQNLPALGLGIISGGLSLGMMGAQSMLTSFAEASARDPSTPLANRITYAGLNGLAEIIGERIGMPSFLKSVRATVNLNTTSADLARQYARHILYEIPGEELTYVMQHLADMGMPAGTNQEADLAKFLLGAAETFGQTVIQSGVLSGVGMGVNKGLQALSRGPDAASQIAKAIQDSVDGALINQGAVDADARAALSPDRAQWTATASPLNRPEPAPPVSPAAQVAADLRAAMNDPRSIAEQETARQQAEQAALQQEQAAAAAAQAQTEQGLVEQYGLQPTGSRVTADIPGMPPFPATVTGIESDPENGGYSVRLRTDDGDEYLVGPNDGEIRPAAQGDGTKQNPLVAQDGRDVDAAVEQNTNPNPTGPQAEAGNYGMTHLAWNGLDISIETAKGGTRTAADGSWSVPDYPAHYGRFKGTIGMDGDHLDTYVGPDLKSDTVFIFDQIDPATGKADEHKVFIGFEELAFAEDAYHAAFPDGTAHSRVGHVADMTVAQFKEWLKDPANLTKPIGYVQPKTPPKAKDVKADEAPAPEAPLTDEDLGKIFDEAAAEQAPAPETPPRSNVVKITDVPPKLLKTIKVSVEQMHNGEVQQVEVKAGEALKDLQEEIAAFEKLLACVRAA